MSPGHLTNLPPYALQNPRAYHFWPGPQAPTGSIRPCPWTSWKRRLTGEWLMTISSSERNSTWVLCWGWCVSREEGRPKVKSFESWGRKQFSNGLRGEKFFTRFIWLLSMWPWTGNAKRFAIPPSSTHLSIHSSLHLLLLFNKYLSSIWYVQGARDLLGSKNRSSPYTQGTCCVSSNSNIEHEELV